MMLFAVKLGWLPSGGLKTINAPFSMMDRIKHLIMPITTMAMILTESTLSYLGLGIQPPTASWGNMLQSAQTLTIMMKAPWVPIVPGFMIFLTIMCFNFVGDGLRNAFDSR